MSESSTQRAARLAADATFKTGDELLVDKTIHVARRPSFILSGVAVMWCGLSSFYAVVDGEKHGHCQECKTVWKVQSQLADLRGDVPSAALDYQA